MTLDELERICMQNVNDEEARDGANLILTLISIAKAAQAYVASAEPVLDFEKFERLATALEELEEP